MDSASPPEVLPIMSTPEQQLAQLGIQLPPVAKPVAAYVPALRHENLVYTSGQLPLQDGKLLSTGKLGLPVSIEQGRDAARQACLNALAAVRSIAGSLDNVERIVNLVVYVQSNDSFADQPKVANGASELLESIFGERGRHTRAAVGVNSLPLNACVELSLIVALRPGTPNP